MLPKISIEDLPDRAAFQIGHDQRHEWEGSVRRDGKQFVADAELLNSARSASRWPRVTELLKGSPQAKVAAAFHISKGLCCQIIKGAIWNPAIYLEGTRGDMMRLRLMAAFDTTVRREEIMLIQLKHINFKPITVKVEGEQQQLLSIKVQWKDEKTTGEEEFVYVGTRCATSSARGCARTPEIPSLT